MSRNPVFSRYYRLIFALIGAFGILGHWYSEIANRPPDGSILQPLLQSVSYYTVQTNLLVLIWLTVAIVYWNREEQHALLRPKPRGAITLYISSTFLIFLALFANSNEFKGLDLVTSIINHYVTPIAFIVDWFLFERSKTYEWRFALHWLIYPLSYLLYNQIYGQFTNDYLYPFFDRPQLGWGGFALRVSVLLLFFVILGSIFIAINRRLPRK